VGCGRKIGVFRKNAQNFSIANKKGPGYEAFLVFAVDGTSSGAAYGFM
jgi:hypothetical protein